MHFQSPITDEKWEPGTKTLRTEVLDESDEDPYLDLNEVIVPASQVSLIQVSRKFKTNLTIAIWYMINSPHVSYWVNKGQ